MPVFITRLITRLAGKSPRNRPLHHFLGVRHDGEDGVVVCLGVAPEKCVQVFPSAIICATAQQLGLLLVTRHTRNFPANHPGVRIPYSI
jgi:hypothetical protein